ncbi:MAG TPA: hypothetical protein VJB59_10740 [Bdellovibrionota bacterium]|nr:hypothetical protein [Bdellovibrionota bacterium]
MKNEYLLISVLALIAASTSALAADDKLVNVGLQQIQQARQQLADIMRSSPRDNRRDWSGRRGWGDDRQQKELEAVDTTLAQAQNTLQVSIQNSVRGYACTVQEKAFHRTYTGHASSRGGALSDALKKCSECSVFGYSDLGCEEIRN